VVGCSIHKQFVTHLCFLMLCELSSRSKLGCKGTPSVVIILCIPGILVTQEEALNMNKHTPVSFVLNFISIYVRCFACVVCFHSACNARRTEMLNNFSCSSGTVVILVNYYIICSPHGNNCRQLYIETSKMEVTL